MQNHHQHHLARGWSFGIASELEFITTINGNSLKKKKLVVPNMMHRDAQQRSWISLLIYIEFLPHRRLTAKLRERQWNCSFLEMKAKSIASTSWSILFVSRLSLLLNIIKKFIGFYCLWEKCVEDRRDVSARLRLVVSSWGLLTHRS